MKSYLVLLALIIFISIPVMGFCGHDQGDDILDPDERGLGALDDIEGPPDKSEMEYDVGRGTDVDEEDEYEYEDEDEDNVSSPNLGGGQHDFKTIDGGDSDSLFDDVMDDDELCWKLFGMSCAEWYFSQLEGAGAGPLTKNGLGQKIKAALERAGLSPFVPGSSTTPGSESAADETPGQQGSAPYDTDLFPGLQDTPVDESGGGGIGVIKKWKF